MLFLVVILGPPLVEKARVPGLIGLLIGGFLIGSHGLGALDAGSTTIPDLGQLGLLYLMFVAGVELDLALLREHRRSAVTFGVLTFAFPMVFGTIAGALLGMGGRGGAAARLAARLPHARCCIRWSGARALRTTLCIASAVGATVLTDTLALIILAVVAGTESGRAAAREIALQLALGFAVLGTFCFVALPWLVQRAFRLVGTERTVRYVIAVAAFLAAAVVAETFGIEGIVGAFFAGLAHEPARTERGAADEPDRLLRRGRVRAGVPRLGRAPARSVGDGAGRDARARSGVRRRLRARQARRRAADAAAARRDQLGVVARVRARRSRRRPRPSRRRRSASSSGCSASPSSTPCSC